MNNDLPPQNTTHLCTTHNADDYSNSDRINKEQEKAHLRSDRFVIYNVNPYILEQLL